MPDVRRVFFENISDVPALLRNEFVPTRAQGPMILSPNGVQEPAVQTPTGAQEPAIPSVPQQATQRDGDVHNTEESTVNEEGPDADDAESDHGAIEDMEIQGEPDIPVVGEDEGLARVEYTDVQERAITVIQDAYRAHAERSKPAKMTAQQGALQRIFTACLQASEKIEWPVSPFRTYSFYRILYLGPLPHLLLCVEGMKEYLHAEKKRAAKRTQQVGHQDLDDAMEKQTKMR